MCGDGSIRRSLKARNSGIEASEDNTMNRRELLKSLSCGFGYLGLAGLATEQASAAAVNPLAPRAPHFAPKAKRVIFLYMQGAPSQFETFDYNPELAAAAEKRKVMAPAFKFNQCGQRGIHISELFPNLSQHADDLCLINSMYTDSPAHPTPTIQLHTGPFTFVRPSLTGGV